MGRAKQVEQIIVKKFSGELRDKFEELNVLYRVADTYENIYNGQISEIQAMRCRIKKLSIVNVIQNPARTAIQYDVLTDRGSYRYELGVMAVPMHMFK